MVKKDISRKQRGREKDEVVFPLSETLLQMPENYGGFIKEIKARIVKTRLESVLAANSAMILLYWEIGNAILQRQKIVQRAVAQFFGAVTSPSSTN
ncbi:MAG TPA: hypothetical protein DCM71_11405 [Runella sp.]|nr:hypothetical protein [Runella sp.]